MDKEYFDALAKVRLDRARELTSKSRTGKFYKKNYTSLCT